LAGKDKQISLKAYSKVTSVLYFRLKFPCLYLGKSNFWKGYFKNKVLGVFCFVSITALLYHWDQNLVFYFCFKPAVSYLKEGSLYRKSPAAGAQGDTFSTCMAAHGVTSQPPPPSAQQLIFLAMSTSWGFS